MKMCYLLYVLLILSCIGYSSAPALAFQQIEQVSLAYRDAENSVNEDILTNKDGHLRRDRESLLIARTWLAAIVSAGFLSVTFLPLFIAVICIKKHFQEALLKNSRALGREMGGELLEISSRR